MGQISNYSPLALLMPLLSCILFFVGFASSLKNENTPSTETQQRSIFVSSAMVFVGITMVVIVGIALLVLKQTLSSVKVPEGLKLPPVYSTGFPIFGNFIAFAKSPLDFITQAKNELGGIFTLNLLAEQCTFLIGQENHAPFFEATDEEMAQAPVYRFMTPIFGKKVVYDAPLNIRRQQMRALGSFLKPAMLRRYSTIIAKETHDYLKNHWGKSGQVDLLPSMAELIILTASATLLGPEVRNELFLEVSHLYEMLDKGLTPLSVFFPNAPLPAHRKRDKAREEMVRLFSKVIKKRRENPDGSKDNIDMLQKLIDFQYKDGRPMSDDEIVGLLIAALFAGQHTSSITTTWTALFLLEDKRNNKGKQYKKLIEELAKLEPSPNTFSSGEGIDSNVLAGEEQLYSCVKESIRVHPPLILLMRRVMKDVVTPNGYFIPKGHRVMVSNAVAQRLSEVFSDPDTWNPDRWSSFDISKLPKYSFIGFGAGIHTCMGEPFAFMQIRTILTVMFSMYEMDLISKFPEPNYDAMVVPPQGPNIVSYKLRDTPIYDLIDPSLRTTPIKQEISLRSDEMEEIQDQEKWFTLEEIQKHDKKGDLWIIVKGKVYDVSNYLDVHQGGDRAILKFGGKDATKGVYGPQHPGTVPTLLERYYIGNVKA